MESRLSASFFLILVTVQVIHGFYSEEERLYTHLTKNYGEKMAPNNLSVSMKVIMRCVMLDEINHIITTRHSESFVWTDDRLAWDPEQFGGCKQIVIPSDKIWTVHIDMLNRMHAEEQDPLDVVVSPNGTVSWIILSSYRFSYLEYKNDKKIPNLARLSYGALTRTVDNMELKFRDTGFLVKYIPECKPYSVSMYRTRETSIGTINGQHRVLEIEFVVKKE